MPDGQLAPLAGIGLLGHGATRLPDVAGLRRHAVVLGREQDHAVRLGHDLVDDAAHRGGGADPPGVGIGAERADDQRLQLDRHTGADRGRRQRRPVRRPAQRASSPARAASEGESGQRAVSSV